MFPKMSVFEAKFDYNLLENAGLLLQEGLLEIPLLKPWSFQTHRFFPVRLKRVVRTVLLCASRGTGHSEGERLLYDTSRE